MIQHYSFGSIVIGGRSYTRDVMVFWDGTVAGWQRKESHKVDAADIKPATDKDPEIIIIGTGEAGVAEILGGAKDLAKSKGIGLVIEKTAEAANIFNKSLEEKKRAVGLFHLTC